MKDFSPAGHLTKSRRDKNITIPSLFPLVMTLILVWASQVVAQPPSPATVDDALDLAQRTLQYVEQKRKVPELAARLKRFEKQAVTTLSKQDATTLLADIKSLRREMIFSHPVLDFEKLLVNKNPPTKHSHNCDQYLGRHSQVGNGPVVLEDWKSNKPRETVLLKGKMPAGAYNKPKLSYDGERVVFAFCDHTQRDSRLRRYFVWECAADGSSVRQLTGTARDAMDRWDDRQTSLIEDNDPCYLADGSIAFVSTRCQGFGRCHNGRYTPALLLHRCDKDGGEVRQISWGEANETDPVVTHDGRLVYTRWEYINRNVTKFHMLWWTRPDGTGAGNFYGNATERPWMISEAMPIPGSEMVLALATGHHTYSAGSIVRIDPRKGEDDDRPLLRVTPETQWYEAERITTAGCYATPVPLNEEMCLAAYSRQKLPARGGSKGNEYAIYLVDTLGGRELIYRDENVSCFSPTPMLSRSPPRVLAPIVEADAPPVGTLTVQDVYLSRNDPKKTITRGSIQSLRINRIINQPAVLKNGGAQPSLVRHEVPKKILGTVPVYEDGSASFEVPAQVPLQLQALDADGKALLTMRSFVYLQSGEQRACVGCHEPTDTSPIPRKTLASIRTPVKIHPAKSTSYDGGFSYKKSVQPVWDRYCISCHGQSDHPKKNGDLDLTGTLEPARLPSGFMKSNPGHVPRSYNELFNRDGESLLGIAMFKRESNRSVPGDYFAAKSGLFRLLKQGHADVELDRESMKQVAAWLDLNSQCYGDFSWNRVETRQADPQGEKRLRTFIKDRFGDAIASQSYHTLVNTAQPEMSRVLLAPLAQKAGGWEQWKNGFQQKNDPAWRELQKRVVDSIVPLQYHDIAGTCGRGNKCVCKSCWVRELVEKRQSDR